ncbi:MAG: hypothetical protein ACK500_12155 [Flavobacteriales bacterium]|jgi:hypothetical protein
MVRAIVCLGIFTACGGNISAQSVNLSDSLRNVFRQPLTPVLKLDTRNSFITGRSAQIWGVKAGVSFGKRFNLGLAYSWLHTDISKPLAEPNENLNGFIRLRYFGPFAEYTFYRKGNWEATVPLQLGFGRSFLAEETGEIPGRLNEGNVFLYEPAMVVDYKILNLIAVGGGVGYRLMLVNNRNLDQRFTAPVYTIRLRVLLDEWVKMGQRIVEE